MKKRTTISNYFFFKFLISPVPWTIRLDLIDGWQGYIWEREVSFFSFFQSLSFQIFSPLLFSPLQFFQLYFPFFFSPFFFSFSSVLFISFFPFSLLVFSLFQKISFSHFFVQSILDFIEENNVSGCVLLSADSHFSGKKNEKNNKKEESQVLSFLFLSFLFHLPLLSPFLLSSFAFSLSLSSSLFLALFLFPFFFSTFSVFSQKKKLLNFSLIFFS